MLINQTSRKVYKSKNKNILSAESISQPKRNYIIICCLVRVSIKLLLLLKISTVRGTLLDDWSKLAE